MSPSVLPADSGRTPEGFARRFAAAHGRPVLLPVFRRLLSDSLTPVLAYRRLVRPDQRLSPSYLFESVVDGERIGRFSFLGSRPAAEVLAYGHEVTIRDHVQPEKTRTFRSDDPLGEMPRITSEFQLAQDAYVDLPASLPGAGGWVGYVGYDTVRYLEGDSLPAPPADDRGLPDLHMQLYFDTVVFDHVQKTLLLLTHVRADQF